MAKTLTQMLLQLRNRYVQRESVKRDKHGRIKKPKPKSPRTEALRYVSLVRMTQKEINRVVKEDVDVLLDAVFHWRQDDVVTDATEAFFASLERKFFDYIDKGLFEQSVAAVAFDVLAFNDKKYERGVYSLVGFNNMPFEQQRNIINSWVKENVKLISNVNSVQRSQLETLIMRATRDGMRRAALGKEISRILDTSLKRGSMIASDQVYKLDGQLDRIKQKSVGIDYYIWRTMGDNRVRPKHQALEGTRRSWDKDSPHPGQEVNCRCIAEPDVDTVFPKQGG